MLQEQAVPRHTLALLKQIGSPLAEAGFYMAGRTALALRMGHRISIDLDFFHTKGFEPSKVVDLLEATVGEAPSILQQTEGSVSVMLLETKIDVLEYRYPMLGAVESLDGIPFCSLADNASMKLSAIMSRGAKKDFIDFAEILESVSLQQLLEWFGEKYPKVERFGLMKSLAWFEDADAEPDPEFLKGQSWAEVKAAIVTLVKSHGLREEEK